MILEAYHGTCDNIKKFNIASYMGNNTGNNGGAIFFTTSKEVAWNYSKEAFTRKNEDIFYQNDINDLLEETSEKQAYLKHGKQKHDKISWYM